MVILLLPYFQGYTNRLKSFIQAERTLKVQIDINSNYKKYDKPFESLFNPLLILPKAHFVKCQLVKLTL